MKSKNGLPMKKTILLFFAITASLTLSAQDNADKLVGDSLAAKTQEATFLSKSNETSVQKPVEAFQVEKKSDKAVKVYENGQLYILRNGKKYNLLGLEVE